MYEGEQIRTHNFRYKYIYLQIPDLTLRLLVKEKKRGQTYYAIKQ